MIIAFVNDTFLTGRGVDMVIYELARILGKTHKVFVIAGQTDIKEENFKFIKMKTEKLVSGGIKDFLFFFNLNKMKKELIKIVKENKIEVLSIHHAAICLIVNSLVDYFGLKEIQLRTVATFHGFPPADLDEKSKIRAFGRKFIRNLAVHSLKNCDKVIAISDYMKNELIKKGIPKEKIVKVYNGVNPDAFFPTEEDKGFMLFVGRHESHKGINKIIRISKELNYPLVITGLGPLSEKLYKYKENIGADKVYFFGKVSREELIRLYQQCSFFISASSWEGFGLIFLEAALCGKSSVAYNLCAMPEVIKNTKTGLLANTYVGFRALNQEMINNPDLRELLGKNAELNAHNFLWDKSAKQYEEVFK